MPLVEPSKRSTLTKMICNQAGHFYTLHGITLFTVIYSIIVCNNN